jgi:hypothetical protein
LEAGGKRTLHFNKSGVKSPSLKNEGKITISIHNEGKITNLPFFFEKDSCTFEGGIVIVIMVIPKETTMAPEMF